MQIAKFKNRDGEVCVGAIDGDSIVPIQCESAPNPLFEWLEIAEPAQRAMERLDQTHACPLNDVVLLPPIDQHEVWAAGVTYQRSQSARMEESEAAADCYERVYRSDRPELFPKAAPHRVVGPNQPLRLRADSKWMVPEPEVALVLNSRLDIVGFTIGNDLSCRDIEGDNPLYLPQAKIFEGSCSLGPWITLAESVPRPDKLAVELVVHRQGETAFSGQSSTSKMARTFPDLVSWLGREMNFTNGAVLLTGTGIVPENEFTLQSGDIVDISIERIGTLSNPIA